MTGYASVSKPPTPAPNATPPSPVAVEVRSVNGRFLDLSLRLSDEWRHLEPAIRERVTHTIRRGKVELKLGGQRDVDSHLPTLHADVIHHLSALSQTLETQFPTARPLSVNEWLHWCRQGGSAQRPDDPWVLTLVDEALAALQAARAREGARLVAVLLEKVEQLELIAAQVEPLVPQVVARHQERFLARWNEALTQAGARADAELMASARERALAEAAAQAIRIDVAEELARLRSHIAEVRAQLMRGGELGKRLDFLVQELHREANTLGSKSTALELSALAVDLKVLIEQIREQVQNIE
ncbi:YicC/YloC family endoribonuclease [Inhella gelatinilytica]|nr:YicC/YloC family endoribonuclease [Inhella gelatinilytica]